ncbi:MAG: CCA tRNA nucleotidyltransferase [Candidatus Micrarchaeota archaeon]
MPSACETFISLHLKPYLMKVLANVLSSIKPSKKELEVELEVASSLLAHIQKHSPKKCEVVLTGSMAKKTFLRDSRDIDVFVLFDKSTPREKLEENITKILKKTFPSIGYQVSYAEHPYLRFHYEGRKVDLVPAYKISKSSDMLSAVDRSVLHTKYVITSLKKGQRDDILLLKKFLKSNSIYGAEIRIKGFSGYLCELLIIKYGTFLKLLKAAAKWEDVFIDLKNYYTPKQRTEAKKRFGFFVVIDPTDKNRNVAAAVSKSTFKSFISASKKFLKSPSEKFFFRIPESFEQKVKKSSKGKFLYLVSMPRPDIVDDILWGQIYKLNKQLKDYLDDFDPKEIIADDSRHVVRLAIVLKTDKLSSKMLIGGPPLKMKERVKDFKKSRKGAKFITKKNKLFAEVKRPVTKAETAIMNFFQHYSKTKSHLAYPKEMIILEKKH